MPLEVSAGLPEADTQIPDIFTGNSINTKTEWQYDGRRFLKPGEKAQFTGPGRQGVDKRQ